MSAATLTEPEFRLAADHALQSLEASIVPLCEQHDVEVDLRNGVLQVDFETPSPARFVVSPNAPVRQVWLSALSRSFKLAWVPETARFELEGESLEALVHRLARLHLGID
jgi:CyaY protein